MRCPVGRTGGTEVISYSPWSPADAHQSTALFLAEGRWPAVMQTDKRQKEPRNDSEEGETSG